MSLPQIAKLEVQGFRSFNALQPLEFESPITAIWGPNSQGKTSLAEAFEFLLTGKIARRELMASSQDEFTDALRNAHMPASSAVFVRAEILGSDGNRHVVMRSLVSDYAKRQDSVTELTIDSLIVGEAALRDLGVVLSQPPLSAPVLAQHTLPYLFSARPQERSSYFKALLEVTDLEAFRADVASLATLLEPPTTPLPVLLTNAANIPSAARFLKPHTLSVPALAVLESGMSAAAAAIIEAEGHSSPVGLSERYAKLVELLADKQAHTFPMKGFGRTPLRSWKAIDEADLKIISDYVAARDEIDDETRRLSALFAEALKIPSVAGAHAPVACPLCDAPDTLTPARVALIRQRLADTEAFRSAQKATLHIHTKLKAAVVASEADAKSSLPLFMSYTAEARRDRGFRVDRIRTLLGPDSESIVSEWLARLLALCRQKAAATRAVRRLGKTLDLPIDDPDALTDVAGLSVHNFQIDQAFLDLSAGLSDYAVAEKSVVDALQKVIGEQTQTAGWQDLIDLADDIPALRSALVERTVYETAQKELDQALKQIDKGNEAALDDKFRTLSDGVERWWKMLRPDDNSFFSSVGPRPGARRTIDFKAGLSPGGHGAQVKLRDAIAVFSQSQLHCLGLAVFLARAVYEGAGFVVLDDPILSSDEDYRTYFTQLVVPALADAGIQTILITQDKGTWRDVIELHKHRGVDAFQIRLANAADGTLVEKSGDEFMAMLTSAEPFTLHDDLEIRKLGGQKLRVAAERFCKLLLVRKRQHNGDATASITDYTSGLQELVPLVIPYLEQKNSSHPGLLNVMRRDLNPSNHDDDVPTQAALKMALGNLRRFRKDYLT